MHAHIKARFIDEEGDVVKSEYLDGQMALMLMQGSQPIAKLSINLIGHGLIAPTGHVYVGDYSENEGLPNALMAAGIAEPVERVVFGPYDTTATLMKVLV